MKNLKVLSLFNNGLLSWIYQRFSAILIGAYALYIIYILMNYSQSFQAMQLIANTLFFKTFTILFIISIVVHSWIGIYTVIDDYIKNKMVDFVLSSLVFLYLVSVLIVSILILF